MSSKSAECGMRSAEWTNRCFDFRHTSHSALATPQSKGFTLLEVLLAMAILSVIMTVVYASFSTAGKNIEQAEALRDENDLSRTLMARLSDDIANAYISPSMNMTSQAILTIFYGKMEVVEGGSGAGNEKIRHDSISLTTLTHWRKLGSRETELWEVGYFFKEKPDGKGFALFRKEKRELNKEVPALEGGDEYELTDRVESLQFRYKQGNQTGSPWVDAWNTKGANLNSLPSLVEIALTLDTGKVYVTQVAIGQ
jgi:prepilin-type N-terminal cleavage/methylation domain-containing protein